MRNILFAASEHGSFNMIYPVLKACSGRYGIGYVGIKPVPVPYSRLENFDVVVTGSTVGAEMECNLWKRARGMDKPAICILDQHKQVSERFTRNGKAVLPDTICVMNDDARKALLRWGISKEKVVVTGSPYLAGILSYKTMAAERKRLKKDLSIGDKKVITFCTEYMVKAGQKDKFGYDEYTLLDELLSQLNRFGLRHFRVYIRLHPNDTRSLYKKYANKTFGNTEVKISDDDPEYKLLQISDVVIGMSSIILVVSSMLGLPIISYQPMKVKGNVFKYNDVISRNLVMNKNSFRRLLNDRLSGKYGYSKREDKKSVNAVGKILDLIENYA